MLCLMFGVDNSCGLAIALNPPQVPPCLESAFASQLALSFRCWKAGGTAGIYAEPRSLDSRSIHDDYAVVWVPRMKHEALNHLCQTNPTAIGITRVGDRVGHRLPSCLL